MKPSPALLAAAAIIIFHILFAAAWLAMGA